MWPFKNKSTDLSFIDESQLVEAIKQAEKNTSGEIRVFIEAHNPMVNVLDRAQQVFLSLKMEKTELRNAVLIYVAYEHKEFALWGDEGIFQHYDRKEWINLSDRMQKLFQENQIQDAITLGIVQLGDWLSTKFPYQNGIDKNDLPDEIVFGL